MRTSYSEKDPVVGHYENIGRSNDGSGMGFMGVLMAIAFIFIVLFLIFRREGRDRDGIETILPFLMNPNIMGGGDEKVFDADKDITNKIAESEREQRHESDNTNNLIDNKFDRLNNRFDRMEDREFQVMLAERTELRQALDVERNGNRNSRHIESRVKEVDDMLLATTGRRPRTLLVDDWY